MSAALFETRRARAGGAPRSAAPPFAGQWRAADDASSATTRRRRTRCAATRASSSASALGVEQFVETVYLDDPDDEQQYVANIFRAPIADGPMRFNADGDYDDARWLGAGELESVWMPPDLRDAAREDPHRAGGAARLDWTQMGQELHGAGVPLAERESVAAATAARREPLPDNRAGWDAIATAYQEQIVTATAIRRALHVVVGALRGRSASARRCARQARARARLRRRAGRRRAGEDGRDRGRHRHRREQIDVREEVRTAPRRGRTRRSSRATCEDLSRFDDESFDLAVSIHALELRRAHRATRCAKRRACSSRAACSRSAVRASVRRSALGRRAVRVGAVVLGRSRTTGRGRSTTASSADSAQWFWHDLSSGSTCSRARGSPSSGSGATAGRRHGDERRDSTRRGAARAVQP